MHEIQKPKLTEFVDYVRQYITGDEKGEAQIYLERLFQAFGHKGSDEPGASTRCVCPATACPSRALFVPNGASALVQGR